MSIVCFLISIVNLSPSERLPLHMCSLLFWQPQTGPAVVKYHAYLPPSGAIIFTPPCLYHRHSHLQLSHQPPDRTAEKGAFKGPLSLKSQGRQEAWETQRSLFGGAAKTGREKVRENDATTA
ncbi:unnamed protein product [Arctogadus glacialis]